MQIKEQKINAVETILKRLAGGVALASGFELFLSEQMLVG